MIYLPKCLMKVACFAKAFIQFLFGEDFNSMLVIGSTYNFIWMCITWRRYWWQALVSLMDMTNESGYS